MLGSAFFVSEAFAANSSYGIQSVAISSGTFTVHILQIDLTNPQLRTYSLTGTSGDCSDNCIVRPLKSYVDQVSGFAGINGSYFCPADYASCANQDGSFYWLWYNSATGEFSNSYQNQFNQGPVIAFDANNRVYYYKTANAWPGKAAFETQNNTVLSAVISNGPGLVFESKLVVTSSQLDDKQRTVKSARSGIGFKGSNVYLIIAAGATVLDLGNIMMSLGMEYAMNLDGGGSSSLVYNSQYKVGPGRNIPNSLVFSEVEAIPPVAPGTSFFAYDSAIRGGFEATGGNVLGDSKEEIITGTAEGLAPQVRVFDGSGNALSQFFAFDQSSRAGVTVAACDIDADGKYEIVAGQGKGAPPLVKIFNGTGAIVNAGFPVLDGKFTGGVNLSCGDIDGNGTNEIVVAARRGGGAQVLVYTSSGKAIANFFAYDPATFRGGINVTTLDMDADGRDEIVTGPQFGAPHIQIFQIRPNEIKRLSPGFYAFATAYRGGVDVGAGDIDGDGTQELLVGVGENARPVVKVYNVAEQILKEFYAYSVSFLGGVRVDGGDVDADGIDEILVAPRSSGGPQVRVIETSNL